jgi:GH18 family chitinase
VVNNANSRAQFANNIVKFAKQYGFNGIDLDWEYPTDKVSNNICLLNEYRTVAYYSLYTPHRQNFFHL